MDAWFQEAEDQDQDLEALGILVFVLIWVPGQHPPTFSCEEGWRLLEVFDWFLFHFQDQFEQFSDKYPLLWDPLQSHQYLESLEVVCVELVGTDMEGVDIVYWEILLYVLEPHMDSDQGRKFPAVCTTQPRPAVVPLTADLY